MARALKWVVVDFETASSCDLKKSGAWRYAEDITTEILCLAYREPGSDTQLWLPGQPGGRLKALAEDTSATFIAHNVQFEKAIWRNLMVPLYGFPDVPNSRWHDTMASCAMKALPLSLDRASEILRLQTQKDTEGSRLTVSLSRTNKKTGMLDRSDETLDRVYQYCKTDVDGEFEAHQRLGWLQPGARKTWLLDQRINERGVKIDLDFVRAAKSVVDRASEPLAKEFEDLTGGLKFTQRDKVLAWCRSQGAEIENFQKDYLAEILGRDDDLPEDYEVQGFSAKLPENVYRALSIRQLIGSASIKKLDSMEACTCEDGVARGLLQWHGAGTGRWAGRLLQPQNFPRGTVKGASVEDKVTAIMDGDLDWIEVMYGPPVELVVSSLRHALISRPGRLFVAGDFSTIELRVNLAFAGETDLIELLKNKGDPYLDMAKKIFRDTSLTKEANPDKRQVGKTAVLGLGFQMGASKFHAQKDMKGQTEEFAAEIVDIFRKEWAPKIRFNWYDFEKASARAVWDRRPQEVKGLVYALEDDWLTCRLPSGRKIYYANPKPVKRAMPWDETDVRLGWTYEAMKMGRWQTIHPFGGHLTENVCQATAADLMMHAMHRAEEEGFPCVLTVHDEIITEPEEAKADHKILEQIMADSPSWAREMNIPVLAEGWSGPRYRK